MVLSFIPGLDPAGPFFEGRSWEVGLNPNCASFVDIMHTNGGPGLILNLGTMKRLGHVDFYPNEGEVQPGCMRDPFDLDRVMEGKTLNEESDMFIGQQPCDIFLSKLNYLLHMKLHLSWFDYHGVICCYLFGRHNTRMQSRDSP